LCHILNGQRKRKRRNPGTRSRAPTTLAAGKPMRVMCDTARSARLAVLGVPVALEVVDQGWAVEAVGLLTGVIAHVAPEQAKRLLDLSEGDAVGGETRRAGAHDLRCGMPDRSIHPGGRHDLVG